MATPSAEAAVRSAIRTFRNSESTARDLISTFYNIVDRDLEKTASLISPLVDLLDDEEKKNELLGAFNGFKVEVRCSSQFLSRLSEALTCNLSNGKSSLI